MIHKKEQNLTVPRMICDKCKFIIPIGAMYWKSDLGRTFCSDCHGEIERMVKDPRPLNNHIVVSD